MSKITDIYNALLTNLDAIFPDKRRLFNSYELETNPNQVLENAFGIAVGPSVPFDGEFNVVNQTASFIIPITRRVVKTESGYTVTDDVSKLILEDIQVLQNELCLPDLIGLGIQIDGVLLGGRSALQSILGEGSERYLFTEQIVDITYRELIS
jgi:hypothetical protein